MVGALITLLALLSVGLILLGLIVLGVIFATFAFNLLLLSIMASRA